MINPNSHPELGTLEPDSSEAFRQLLHQLSEKDFPVADYAIDIEEIKQAVAISLKPSDAFELAAGLTKVILMSEVDEQQFGLMGHYCLMHAARVTGEKLAESDLEMRDLGLSPEIAPTGSIIGYCTITGLKRYTSQDWAKDGEQEIHPYGNVTLSQYKKQVKIKGDLYAVIVGRPMLLSDPVFDVPGDISIGFWEPKTPYESAVFRQVFEVDRPVLDVEREIDGKL